MEGGTDNSIKISNLWVSKLDSEKPYVRICVPQEIINLQVYNAAEYVSLLGFHDAKEEIDAEQEEERRFTCFFKNLETSTEKFEEFFAEAQAILERASSLFKVVLTIDVLKDSDTDSQDKGKFWRYLISVDNSLKDELDPEVINNHKELEKDGAHSKLELRENGGFIRVKARNLKDLVTMVNDLINKII